MDKSEAGRLGNAAARAAVAARGEVMGGPATPQHRADAARIIAAAGVGVAPAGRLLRMDRKTVSKVLSCPG